MPSASAVPEGREAARGGAQRAAGFLAGQLLTVGAVALLFRHLGVDDTGRYVTVLSLVAIVAGLTDLGLTTLGTRELSLATDERRAGLIADLLGLRLAATAVGVALVVGLAALLGYPAVMVAGTAIVGAGLLVQNAGTTLATDLLARLRGGRVALADLLRQATAALLVVAGVAAGAGLLAFFALLVPAALVGFAVVATAVRRGRPSLAVARWRALAGRAIPFAVAAAASVLFFRLAVVELSLLGTERETGLFGASFRVIEVLAAVPALAVSAAFPVFSRAAHGGDDARLASAVARTSAWCVAAGGALAVGLALGAPAVIEVVAGPSFAGAADLLAIQGAALLCSFVAAPWAFALLSLGRERVLMWINVAGVALAAGLVAALVVADGARGAAIATVIGEAALAVSFAVALSRARPGLRPAGLVRPLGAAVAAAAAGFALPVPAVPRALIGLALYLLALWLLRALPDPRVLTSRAGGSRPACPPPRRPPRE